VVYEWMMADGGNGIVYFPIFNYSYHDFSHLHQLLQHPGTMISLGDGGAHYGAICDASYSTFLLKHFVRDGTDHKIDLASAIHMLTAKAARAVGLNDRGLLKVGMKADINVIDMNRLTLPIPHIVHDLPAGGRRLDQAATGYDATIVSGAVIRRMDVGTGVYPGRLVRGARAVCG